jgi:hypothetical protein
MTENDIPTAYQYAEGPVRKRSPDMMKAEKMKFKEDRPFATPEAAEQKLPELANAIEADHAGRLSVEVINRQFLASPLWFQVGANPATKAITPTR